MLPRSEGSEPHIRFPSPKVPLLEKSPHSTGLRKPVGRPRGLWEIETPLLKGKKKIPHALGPRAEAVFNRILGQVYQLILESLPRRQEATGAHPGDIGAEALWRSLFFHVDTGDGKCHFGLLPLAYWAFLVAQMVKNLPSMQEIQL